MTIHLRSISLLAALCFSAMASAMPPGLDSLATALDDSEVHSLGTFEGLNEAIARAEAQPRSGMLVGINRQLTLSQADANTQPLNNGNTLWRIAIQSPDAAAVSLHFSQFALANGAKLWLYAPDSEQPQGPYGAEDANRYGEFWSPQVLGDTIVVELEQRPDQRSQFKISQLNHGHRAWWQQAPPASRNSVKQKAAGSCHVNVSCPEGASHGNKIRATARIIYNDGNQSFACSGTLMNNTAQDATPYFLTANHCINSNSVAATATTYWAYESATCGSDFPPLLNRTIAGASLVATWATNDFTLLQLDSAPNTAHTPYWSGWDRSVDNLSNGIAIHHPAGDVKKISLENDPLLIVNGSGNPGDATNLAGLYVRVSAWDLGSTEGGSSGSGLWGPNDQLLGQLSAGSADCNAPNGQDFYGWIGQAWEGGGSPNSRLKDWLAPNSGNSVSLSGCDHINDNCSGGSSSGGNTNPGSQPSSGGGGGGGGSGAALLLLIVAFIRLRFLRPIAGA